MSYYVTVLTRRVAATIVALVVAVSLVLVAGCSAEQKVPSGTIITQTELIERLHSPDKPMLLDVRSESEFRGGHISDAINISHTQLPEHLEQVRTGSQGRQIVVYCESGKRAGLAEKILVEAGINGVRLLEGHMALWREKNLPLEK